MRAGLRDAAPSPTARLTALRCGCSPRLMPHRRVPRARGRRCCGATSRRDPADPPRGPRRPQARQEAGDVCRCWPLRWARVVVNTAQARAVSPCRRPLPRSTVSSRSSPSSAPRPRPTWSVCARPMTPTRSPCWAARSSRSSAPSSPRPTRARSSPPRKPGPPGRPTSSMWLDDQGVAHGRFRIPARHAEMLRKAIQALTNPVRQTPPPAAASTPTCRSRCARASRSAS